MLFLEQSQLSVKEALNNVYLIQEKSFLFIAVSFPIELHQFVILLHP